MTKTDTEFDEELETYATDNALCPWCKAEYTDSWEMEDGEYECDVCNKKFSLWRDVSVTYTTHKVKEKPNV